MAWKISYSWMRSDKRLVLLRARDGEYKTRADGIKAMRKIRTDSSCHGVLLAVESAKDGRIYGL